MTDTVVHQDALLTALAGPAALLDDAGIVCATNDAFELLAGPCLGTRVEIQGARGILASLPQSLVVTPLQGGGWLALATSTDGAGATATVATAVARRLERLETSLEANAQLGLLEAPPGAVARSLRETLALTEELRMLRRQVAALGGPGGTERLPANLDVLVREAARLLVHRAVVVSAPDADYTIEVDRAYLLPLLVGLFDDLAAGLPVGDALRVDLRGGDLVRLQLLSPATPVCDTPAIAAARRFLAANGGRVLLEPEVGLVLEIPAFARGLRASGGFGTVLIVDDDESALAMMGAVLRRVGFRVLAAEDGVEASALLRQNLRDIVAIVADAVLPGRSGVELAAEARRSVPGLPVLLVSGHSSDLVGTNDFGHLPILPKPFGARTLAERVRAMLEPGDPQA